MHHSLGIITVHIYIHLLPTFFLAGFGYIVARVRMQVQNERIPEQHECPEQGHFQHVLGGDIYIFIFH